MSSLVRTIQRTTAPHYKGRGSKLGVHNPRAKDLLARLAREARG